MNHINSGKKDVMGTLAVVVFVHFVSAFSKLDAANIGPVILLTVVIIIFLLAVAWMQIRFFKK